MPFALPAFLLSPFFRWGIAIAAIVVLFFLWRAAEKGERAALDRLEIMTADRDAQAKAVKVGQGIITRQQAIMDENDAKAQATIKVQQADVLRLASQLQASADNRETLLQQIKDAAHARPTVNGVPTGWDPVVLAGMRCLRGVQLGHGLDAPDCRIQAADDSGRSGAAGDSAGANSPRPSAEQQADFLAFAWRLRDWGASCYADKRAIAASQTVAP